MSEPASPLVPREGWHVMHLFYHVDQGQWQLLSPESERREAKTCVSPNWSRRSGPLRTPSSSPLRSPLPRPISGSCFSRPDLQVANAFEKRLTLSLGADVLTPAYSYLSQTERSEYTTTSEQYVPRKPSRLRKGLEEGSKEFEEALQEFEDRMEHYLQHRLYPVLPDWPAICFYPDVQAPPGRR